LIFHYVEAHGYLPPRCFIEAVMQDNPENVETAAERHRTGAQFLQRMLLGWLSMKVMRRPEGADPKNPKSNYERKRQG
jgi:hypothetical protein